MPNEQHEQRTPEWFEARRGKVTASRIGDILATLKSGNWAASRRNYAAQLVTERLDGEFPEPITNEFIEWGKEQEPFARDAYTAKTGNVVTEVGFIDHPSISCAGASPDGLVGEDGLIEIKCLNTANHLDMLINEEVKDQYVLQMFWQMACTGRNWCDFVSYDPRAPKDLQLFIKRFTREDGDIPQLESDVADFIREVDAMTEALKKKYREPETGQENQDW